MFERIRESAPVEWSLYVLGWLGLCAALAGSIHVILRKRDSRSAISWLGLIWLSPFVGAFLYLVFGVNRIRRRAQAIRPRESLATTRETLGANVSTESAGLLRLGDSVTRSPAVGGNSIEFLNQGEQAYPAMLTAIRQARFSVTLATYIFDNDAIGQEFVQALGEAVERGVQVRVLIDDVGARYSKKPMDRELRRRGVRTARFLPVFRPRSFLFINLRLHRKILVVDGMLAFTGGMNIREGHLVSRGLDTSVRDIHFRIRGPVVEGIQKVFAEDWEFTTRECLKGDTWFAPLSDQGPVLARCVDDGPDMHFESARWILLGAISSAKHRIRIMTPYFVPDAGLIMALNTAALRGIRVQIVVPSENNLPWVKWASRAMIWDVLERGCEVYSSPPPFDHSKLMIIDDGWTLVGSANWDARSLRLNFEMNVEAFDTEFTALMSRHFDHLVRESTPVRRADLDRRPLWMRLRDGFIRLFAPYL